MHKQIRVREQIRMQRQTVHGLIRMTRQMSVHVSMLVSAMHCTTPYTAIPRWLGRVLMEQTTPLRNGIIRSTVDKTRVARGPPHISHAYA